MVKRSIYIKYIKRPMDVILSFIALMILFPLLIIISISIKLNSTGPIFFKQNRMGRNGRIFKIYKFRTMIKDAEKYQKLGVEVTEDDSRITSVGRILRRYKLDEFPQLINIIRGDMSIVGPRPTLPGYLKQYEDWELKRLQVKPGLTGLAQINGGIYLALKEKNTYDVMYVEQISFISDIKIILKTVAIVLLGEHKFVNK